MQITCFRLMIYSFCGWLLEGAYQFITQGTFLKPNFLFGPFKPMYGIASVLLLAVKSLGKGSFFLCSLVIPLGVEYISGLWLKNVFGLQYWDYSEHKFNLQGLICLDFAIAWVALAYVFVYFLQPKLAQGLHLKQNGEQKKIFWLCWAVFVGDVICTLIKRMGGTA